MAASISSIVVTYADGRVEKKIPAGHVICGSLDEGRSGR